MTTIRKCLLELESEPEADAAEAAVLQCRVAETGELLMQARIIDERINASTHATKVRVVENIGHGRVENHVQPLFYFKIFVKREIAGVRSSVTQTVARSIAKRSIEYRGRYGRVGYEAHVLVCHRRTDGIALVDGIQANQLGCGQLAAYAKVITGIARENSYSICRSSGVT